VDLSPVALDVARNNARRLGTEERIEFVPGDFTAPLPAADLDLVVANPPYVTWAEHGELSREVADFEPRSALVSGGEQGDGLDHVRGLAPRAADALRPGGTLLVEIGWQQGETGAAILGNPALGLCDVRVLKDLAGLDRILAARKRPC
jgi:release factor glutamine methyltransferase